MKIEAKIGNPMHLGISTIAGAVNFSVTIHTYDKCSLLLFKRGTKNIEHEIDFSTDMIFGNVAAMSVTGIKTNDFDYAYRINDKIYTDPYSPVMNGTSKWGEVNEDIVTGRLCSSFDWEGDKPPHTLFHETIMYRLHVRGFTKDKTAKAKHKGTFQGITEKIDYLKELGITLVELMPAYDFNEVMIHDHMETYDYNRDYGKNQDDYPVNYWGYTSGYYFAPKASFSSNKKAPDVEFKNLVKELHKNGIEISMEFCFDYNANPHFIIDCLRYWVLEYHIDGVHLFANDVVMKMLDTDPILAKTKIFSWDLKNITDDFGRDYKHLASFNDGFLVNSRKFLKGDEGQTGEMAKMLRYNPDNNSIVNYVANHSTFTLMDTVSYDRKHNEANGESNNDGAEYNYSWNCGEEGPSKKRRIVELRKRLIKNAIMLLMTAQGVPMIYAGDECGNSQNGNNNAYCQDNETGWVNWKSNVLSKEIFVFTKEAIAMRKAHPVLHTPNEPKIMDYMAYGLPDLSYHGNTPWYSDYDHVNRHFALMYCGKYSTHEDGSNDDDIYIAYNMFWESQLFDLPTPLSGNRWVCELTSSEKLLSIAQIDDAAAVGTIEVPPRTIVVLKSVK